MFFFLFFFLLRLHAPFFIGVFSLYSPFILHPHLPLVDLLDDLLDVYPIQNPLEALWIVVNWDITVQVSFSHKCGQLVRCKAFNMVVVGFFPNISSFVVGYLPWSLSTKGMITFCTAFPRWLGSNLSQCFPEEAQLLGNYHQFVVILVPSSLIPKLDKPYDHPRVSSCPQARPTAQLIYSPYLPSQLLLLLFLLLLLLLLLYKCVCKTVCVCVCFFFLTLNNVLKKSQPSKNVHKTMNFNSTNWLIQKKKV